MNDIELCAGMGGMALALQSAGFNPTFLYELDKNAFNSLQSNIHKKGGLIRGNIVNSDIRNIRWENHLDGSGTRLLSAGLPCQPFSNGGLRKGQNDARNLFPVLFDATARLRPNAIIIENVKGLATGCMKPYLLDSIQRLAAPAGKGGVSYHVSWDVLNSADFGSPQIRHRLIIVAVKKSLHSSPFIFPEPTHSAQKLVEYMKDGRYWERHNIRKYGVPRQLIKLANRSYAGNFPWLTVRDAFDGLGAPQQTKGERVNGHQYIPGARIYKGHTGSDIDMPSKAIKAGTSSTPGGENIVVFRNGKFRYFTVREIARIQGIPDKYRLFGARGNLVRQLGNTVPSQLIRAVGRRLIKYLYY